jgi:hypothetical protein
MYYEINISKNGVHYFATAERSLKDFDGAQRVAKDLQARFPKRDGFIVTLRQCQNSSCLIAIEGKPRKAYKPETLKVTKVSAK